MIFKCKNFKIKIKMNSYQIYESILKSEGNNISDWLLLLNELKDNKEK